MSVSAPRRDRIDQGEELEIRRVLFRMRAHSIGIAIGLLCGVGLFVATNVLLLRGGENIGSHLGLLASYIPGYTVSFAGSVIGFVCAAAFGYGIGFVIATLYNKLADLS